MYSNFLAFISILSFALASPQRGGNNGNNGGNNNAGNAAAGGTSLNAANVQKASQSDGNPNRGEGQSASQVDDANFINFCNGKEITNGAQVTGGSCNGIVMGDIPSQGNMISSIIISPAPGQNIAANTNFNIEVQISNLVAGVFTNPDNTYYAAPQTLQGGRIVGHCHVTVQELGNSLAPNTPPNAATFAFFKGINDNGNGNGRLSATVAGGLPAGNYRVCTMNSASNHQPVLMPVAQRGAQDDCTKFTVGGNGGNNANTGNGNANAGNGGNNDSNGRSNGANGGNGNASVNGGDTGRQQTNRGSATTSAARAANTANGDNGRQQGGRASTSSAAAASTGNANNGRQGGRASATTAAAAATTSSSNRNEAAGRNDGQKSQSSTAAARSTAGAATNGRVNGNNGADMGMDSGRPARAGERRRHRFQSREYIGI